MLPYEINLEDDFEELLEDSCYSEKYSRCCVLLQKSPELLQLGTKHKRKSMSSVLLSFVRGLKLGLAETVMIIGLMPMARELRVTCSNQHLCSPYITLSAAFTHRAASQSLILLLHHKPQQYFYHINILL